MKYIFVNLKRFEVTRALGGICPEDSPKKWIEGIVTHCVSAGLGRLDGMAVTFFVPEALVIPAVEKMQDYSQEDTASLYIGCQGVYREDIIRGKNFGAFTTNRPAAAIKILGATWALVGHSEERKDKRGIIKEFADMIDVGGEMEANINGAIHRLINQEVLCALDAGLDVVFCIGETAEERGGGNFEEQKPRIEAVLKEQIEVGLTGIDDKLTGRTLVIGYEPVWAIGPGKTPPDSEYIAFVSSYIKQIVKGKFGLDLPVVYGGGLKEENAGIISAIKSIDGGLVGLTQFTGEIGFYPDGLVRIIQKYGD